MKSRRNKKYNNNKENIRKKSKKSKNIKIFIGIVIVILVIIILAINLGKKDRNEETYVEESEGLTLFDTKLGEYVKETEDGIKINISPKLNQDKKIGELSVTNIQLTAISGVTTLLADVSNNTESNTDLKNITAIFLDENGSEIYSAKGVVRALKVGETTRLNISISSNYITAYNVEFK